MRNTRPSIGKYYKLPNPGLRAYFKHTVDGNSEDYRPPFWKGKSRELVLEMWEKELDSTGVKIKFPSLYEYEMEMKSKVGPMSIQAPLTERVDSIEDYYKGVSVQSEPISQAALDKTVEWFSPALKGLRLRSKSKTIENMRLNTNSGCPYFTKRKLVKDKILNSRISGNKVITPDGEFELAATLG